MYSVKMNIFVLYYPVRLCGMQNTFVRNEEDGTGERFERDRWIGHMREEHE